VQIVANGYGCFSTLYKLTPWLIYDAFDALNIPEATPEKRRECLEPRDEDLELEIFANLKKSTI